MLYQDLFLLLANKLSFLAACSAFRCFTIMSVLETSSIAGGKLIELEGRFGFLPNTCWFGLKP